MNRTTRILATATLVGFGAGCHGAVVLSGGTELACSGNTAADGLAGNWVIVGSGNRAGCSDGRYEGAFTLGPSQPIAIAVAAPDAGSNAASLTLAASMTGFTLTGTAQSSCITFETAETTSGPTTTYAFTGTLQGGRAVSGTFSGSGPGTCVATGSFRVTAQ